jgi:aryl-alcohol dehydrogenase-like predicted oxidoreductase
MRYSRIGSLEVSLAGLGCNNLGHDHFESRLGPRESREIVEFALECGITLFDTSDAYEESESLLGSALAARRDEVVISTKFGAFFPPNGLRPGHPAWVKEACARSLGRLRTDHIDLYMMHHPDPGTPIAETLGAMGELVSEGKVLEIGCSNFSRDAIIEADQVAKGLNIPRFVTVEDNYSLLNRSHEADVIPACQELGMSLQPYFPLASGMLTGKYRRGESFPANSRFARMAGAKRGGHFPDLFSDDSFSIVESLSHFAEERGHTLVELALSWLACQPVVTTVTAGATTPEQVRSNAAATLAWRLDPSELAEVDKLTSRERAFTVSIAMTNGHLADEVRHRGLPGPKLNRRPNSWDSPAAQRGAPGRDVAEPEQDD